MINESEHIAYCVDYRIIRTKFSKLLHLSVIIEQSRSYTQTTVINMTDSFKTTESAQSNETGAYILRLNNDTLSATQNDSHIPCDIEKFWILSLTY